MKKLFKYNWLFLLLMTTSSYGQDIAKTTNKNWLETITNNAIAKPKEDENFYHAPSGFALYFTKVDSLHVPYLVYIPKNYDSAKPSSLIVFLHGAVISIDSFQYNNASFAQQEPIFLVAEKHNAIVLYPFGKKDFGWVKQQAAFENILTEISAIEQVYNINKNNVFLGGMSNGGSAAFWFITYHPQLFTAFYAFSAMPKLYQSEISFKNISKNKPLFSINAKDDEGYSFDKVKSVYEQHKAEAKGWHFDSVETGNHGFIYNDSGWSVVNDLFVKLNNFSSKQKATYDSIAQVCINVIADDQKFRNELDDVREKHGAQSKEMKSLFTNMSIADSVNLLIVKDIISKYGWLGADEIGNLANNTLFMVIQHSDLKTQEAYLPLMRKAVKNGKAKASDLALLEDRVALKEGRSQIYGSQLSWNLKTNTFIILPIIDPDNLDKRRAEVGLVQYAIYLKESCNLTWDIEQYKKELPEIKRQFMPIQ
ncbi:MAG: alpha/beta hydrolase-fold protein [Bacteroidota bacterium]|nr:alpha/beta hydrolase-fold protein [Bacteroidota bacterium]